MHASGKWISGWYPILYPTVHALGLHKTGIYTKLSGSLNLKEFSHTNWILQLHIDDNGIKLNENTNCWVKTIKPLKWEVWKEILAQTKEEWE